MRSRKQNSCMLAALSALAIMSVGERRVAAATTSVGSSGIIIGTAHSTQVGDPQYEYLFQITVYATGNDQLTAGSTIMVDNLTGLANPPSGTGSPQNWFGNVTGPDTVEYVYTGPTISNTVVYSLGQFYVGPTDLPPNSSPPTPLITYTGVLDGVTNTGNIQVTYVVPEPSSAILLGAGIGALTLLWAQGRKRHHQVKKSTAA